MCSCAAATVLDPPHEVPATCRVQLVAVEPTESPVISGGNPGPHKIQGIGAGFIPGNLDTSLLNETLQVASSPGLRLLSARA